MDNRLQFTVSLKNIIKKHGTSLYEDSSKLKAFLMDYLPSMEAERNLLVSAINAGIFDIINSSTEENKDSCYSKAIFTLQNDLFIEENTAEYIVYSVAYSLDLCSKKEIMNRLEKANKEEASGNSASAPSVNVSPNINPVTPANNSNSNATPKPSVNPPNPNNGQNASTNTNNSFTDIFKNKFVMGIACGILMFGIGFAGYSLMGSGSTSGSGIVMNVPYEAKGIPIYSGPNPISKPIKLLRGNQRFNILDKKTCSDEVYVLNGEYGLLKIASSFEHITGNKTIIFKVLEETVNPNRLSQKGSLIQYYDENGLVKAFIRAVPSQISRVGDSIKGKELYKIKLEDGTVGWIFSGFTHSENKVNANRTEKVEASPKKVIPPVTTSKVEEKLNDYIIEMNNNGKEIRQLSYSIGNWADFTKIRRIEVKNTAASAKARLVDVRNKYQSQYKGKVDYSETLLKIFNKEIEIYDTFILMADTADRKREQDFERLYNEYLSLERNFKQEK